VKGGRIAAAVLVAAFAVTAHADTPGEEAAKLIKKLARAKDADERSAAAERLGYLGSVDAVPALSLALRDKDSGVRSHAAGALLRIGEPAKAAMPALREALFDSDATTVWNAAGALKNMGVVTTDLLAAYRRLLLDRDCDMKVSAAVAISEYVPPAEVLPIALACRTSRESDVEKGVRALLASIAKERAAVPLFIETLETADAAEVREWAARALGDAGGAGRPGLPALRKALEDEDERVRTAAHRAVSRIER
jgi:HEAT repeat protein